MTDAPNAAQPPKNTRPRFEPTLDWITRPLFGLLLAALAVGATLADGIYFAIFIAAGAIAAAREWHRMFAPGVFMIHLAITAASIVLALACVAGNLTVPTTFPWVVLMAGTIANFAVAAMRKSEPSWHAFGVLYIGVAAVSMVMLRVHAGFWVILILFATVWATDTGALFTGNLIGGPKLAPVLSPNKTWAGFFGGIVCAAITGAIILAFVNGAALHGAIFGASVGLVSHAGDMFESWVKRRVGRKNSGSLIPGHGGVLDRIDSILLAAPVCALVVFTFGAEPLLGMQP